MKDHYPLSGKLVKITSTVDINILDQTAQGVNPSLDLEYAMWFDLYAILLNSNCSLWLKELQVSKGALEYFLI